MMENSTDSEKRTELFRKAMKENRKRILNSLANTPEVIRQLNQLGVLGNKQLARLIHMPSLSIQKTKLINMLLNKDFEVMDKFIKVLGYTGNQALEYLLDFYRDQILKDFPVDDKNRENLPPHGIEKDSHERRDSGNRSSGVSIETDPEDPIETDPLSIPLKPISPQPPSPAISTTSILIDISGKKCAQCSYLKLFRAASEGNVDFLKKLLESENYQKEKLEPCEECFKQTRGQTLLHAAVLAKNSADVVACVELLLAKLCGDVTDSILSGEDSLTLLLNTQDDVGQTAIHLAAKNERSTVVEKLYYDYNCDILIKNKLGLTALDLIYTNIPKVAWGILNKETLPLAKNNDSVDGNFDLEIDFGRIIGCPLFKRDKNNEANNKAADKYIETRTLTKLVESNTDASYILLSHVMVKTFLDLKWSKMSPFLYSYMVLKVLLYIWYTLFVVSVFLAQCPITSNAHVSPAAGAGVGAHYPSESDTSGRNIFTYLFGDWKSAAHALTGFQENHEETNARSSTTDGRLFCSYNPKWQWQPLAFLIIGILLFVKEILEALVLTGVQHNQRIFEAYWNSWENRFQLAFIALMILIGTMAFQPNIPDYYYSYAALSIVVVWALIFMQVGYLLGQGVYVQLLGKIIKRFGTLMLNYLCWIIAFSIALSILFPHDKPFETLPKSFLRVITMMSGELNYENTFYGHQAQNGGNDTEAHQARSGPVSSIVFTAHIIYISVALLLTIVLSNALIGLVVTDVQELQERAEVLLRSIKVDKMYTMEVTLLRLQRFLPCLKNILNIFVIHPSAIWQVDGDRMPTGDGMVLKISIKDIPKDLQQEVREFALNPKAYSIKTPVSNVHVH